PACTAEAMSASRVNPQILTRVRIGYCLLECGGRIRGLVAIDTGAIRGFDFDLHRVWVDGGHAGFVMHDHAGEDHDRRHHDQLDHDERHRTPVYLPRGHRFDHLAGDLVLVAILRGHGTQVEQGKAEGRMHE